MATDRQEIAAAVLATPRKRRMALRRVVRFLKTKPVGAVGLALLLVQVVAAILAPLVAPFGPYETHMAQTFSPPDRTYWLGTDEFGRDSFSRIVYGARISLSVSLSAVFVAKVIALVVGIISGYLGGKVDLIVQRFVDMWMAFPSLIFAMAIISVLGQNIVQFHGWDIPSNVIWAIALTTWAVSSRVIRSQVLSVKESQYVEAARAIGCSQLRIMFVHVMPQTYAPLIIIATAALGSAILAEAALSFLGLGTPPPAPSWGVMLSGVGRANVELAPWLSVFPGIAISLAVLGFNLFGDALRDVLDPRLRSR